MIEQTTFELPWFFYKNEPVGGTHYHMNDFTRRLVLKQRYKFNNSEMNKGDISFWRNCGAASVGVLQNNVVLSTELTMWIGHRKEILKLMFRALAPEGGGGTPRKIGWGCAARFPKPLPYLRPRSAKFPTLFMTWPKIRNPIYDLTLKSKPCLWPAL